MITLIKMTESAVNVLLEAIQNEKRQENEKLYVRMSMGIGWGGPQLKLSLEEQPLDGDKVFEIEGIPLIVNERDYVYFDNTKLDYVKNIFGVGNFTVLKI